MGKTIHAADAADVYPSIGCGLSVEVIFLYDFLQYVAEFDFCKFGSFEWCHEVEVARSMLINCAPTVEITLLRNILIKRSVAVLVPTSSG